MLIFDQLAEVVSSEMAKRPIKSIARLFNRSRGTVYDYSYGCNFVCDMDFVCGLRSLGYDIIITKRGEQNNE